MNKEVDRDTVPLFPCPRCQKLARRVQRRRWTRKRLIVPLIIGVVAATAFSLVSGAVAIGALVGVMSAAVGFALAPILYLNLECDSCGYEEAIE